MYTEVLLQGNTFSLETMSLASVKCILKQLATKLRIPSSSLVLHVRHYLHTENTILHSDMNVKLKVARS